jgi:radical SAM superfamily enzyme YgiQ (UPF0313 family)
MKDDIYLKTLISASTPIPYLESDEIDENADINIDAEIQADMADIVDNIGKEEFKDVYVMGIGEIKKLDFDKKIQYCRTIIKKIEEVYEYYMVIKPDLETDDDVLKILDLIKFIEYDNIKFFVLLLEGYLSDLNRVDVEKFYNENYDLMMNRIEKMKLSQFISDFLRTNTKENVLNFFINSTNKIKTDLTCILLYRKKYKNKGV